MAQPLVELDRSVGYALKQAAAALRTAMDAELRSLGLSVSQYSCLEVLRQRPRLSAAAVARATFVTRQSMHAVLLGLQERGLLARPAVPEAGRALPTELTESGLRLLEQASARVAAVEQRMLSTLPPDRLPGLRDDLAGMVAGLVGRVEAEGEPAEE
jgi:DNA-binding MarR family transcriptional regulator